MATTIGRSLALGSAAAALLSTFLAYFKYDDGYSASYWEMFSRWDVITAVMCLALAGFAVAGMVHPRRFFDSAIVVLTAAQFGNLGAYGAEVSGDLGIGGWLGALAALLAIASAILLMLEQAGLLAGPLTPLVDRTAPTPVMAPPMSATVQPVPPMPVFTPPQPVPPAGWYADPAAPGLQRYWDGLCWTQQTAFGATS